MDEVKLPSITDFAVAVNKPKSVHFYFIALFVLTNAKQSFLLSTSFITIARYRQFACDKATKYKEENEHWPFSRQNKIFCVTHTRLHKHKNIETTL
jgi:hypothetical protein